MAGYHNITDLYKTIQVESYEENAVSGGWGKTWTTVETTTGIVAEPSTSTVNAASARQQAITNEVIIHGPTLAKFGNRLTVEGAQFNVVGIEKLEALDEFNVILVEETVPSVS